MSNTNKGKTKFICCVAGHGIFHVFAGDTTSARDRMIKRTYGPSATCTFSTRERGGLEVSYWQRGKLRGDLLRASDWQMIPA